MYTAIDTPYLTLYLLSLQERLVPKYSLSFSGVLMFPPPDDDNITKVAVMTQQLALLIRVNMKSSARSKNAKLFFFDMKSYEADSQRVTPPPRHVTVGHSLAEMDTSDGDDSGEETDTDDEGVTAHGKMPARMVISGGGASSSKSASSPAPSKRKVAPSNETSRKKRTRSRYASEDALTALQQEVQALRNVIASDRAAFKEEIQALRTRVQVLEDMMDESE